MQSLRQDPGPRPCCQPGTELQALQDRAYYVRQARFLKAIANPARLQIIHRLAQGECSVGALARLVGLDQSTVSKHLATLRLHGIVEDRRQGNVVFYRLLTPCVLDFFACTSKAIGLR